MKKETKYLMYSVLLGILFALMFYKKQIGVSYPLFMTILLIALGFVMKAEGLLKKDFAWLISIPIALLSFTFFLSNNRILAFFNNSLIILLFVSMTILLVGRKKTDWANIIFVGKIIEYICVPIIYINKPYKYIYENLKFVKSDIWRNISAKVILGIIISLPLALVIVVLLSSADAVFNEMIAFIPRSIEQFFKNQKFVDITLQIIIAVIVATYIYSYIYMFNKEREKAYEQNGILERQSLNWLKLDSIIIITVLSVINLIYIVFCIIQFKYLFGGSLNGLQAGLSYAEYARRGFFELFAASLLNFSIILFSLNQTELIQGIKTFIIKALLLLISANTFVLLYSSFYRMGLYQQKYGYTYLRVFVYFFLIVEAISLVYTCMFIIKPRMNLIKTYIVIFLVCFIGLNYINIDKMIAQNNIDRYFATGDLDTEYLFNLSTDSIPELCRLLDANDQTVVQEVKNHLAYIKKDIQSSSWLEFNISKYTAQKGIDKTN